VEVRDSDGTLSTEYKIAEGGSYTTHRTSPPGTQETGHQELKRKGNQERPVLNRSSLHTWTQKDDTPTAGIKCERDTWKCQIMTKTNATREQLIDEIARARGHQEGIHAGDERQGRGAAGGVQDRRGLALQDIREHGGREKGSGGVEEHDDGGDEVRRKSEADEGETRVEQGADARGAEETLGGKRGENGDGHEEERDRAARVQHRRRVDV
jgi:hypothetical protein